MPIVAARYELYEKLGEGGMGSVYRALDSQTQTLVALKHLKNRVIAQNPDMIERFKREGDVLRQLNHPNIVKLLATIEYQGEHYLIMEYVSGGSLQTVLEKTAPLPVDRVLKIGLELADALVRTHHLKIIHRDIKPANILLAADGTPRLSDFGIAYIPSQPRITDHDAVVGSFAYLAPEGLRGDPLDTYSDLWSFGVLLFEMLTGRLPFPQDQIAALMLAVLNDPTPDLEVLCPQAPVALIDLIYRLLEKEPKARLSSARLVGAELEAIMAGGISIISPRQTPIPTPPPDRPTPTPHPDHTPRHNLPAQTTPFVGREEELNTLTRMVNDSAIRLITIIGPGGIGKTRLSLELAARFAFISLTATRQSSTFIPYAPLFPDGIFFVPLAPLSNAEGMIPAIAEAVGFQFYEGSSPREQLADFFQPKSILLILDNCEHVLAGTPWVDELLRQSPHLKIITTSRERLNLTGENVFILDGMELASWESVDEALQYSAVQLFLQSAQRVRPSFEITAENLPHVASICRLVQGMPLGLVLAAAWIEMLSPQEIAAEVAKNLDFLATDMHDIPPRQRSIRAVFDYSWELLVRAEQDAFMKVAVFRGGFTRDAAQKITEATLRTLITLVNKSLLRRDPTGRYEVHDLLRQFAEAKLDAFPHERTQIHDRHSTYYANFLEQQTAHLKGTRQTKALDDIEIEWENIRAAWQWATQHRATEAIDKAVESLYLYLMIRSLWLEGATLFQTALNHLEFDPTTQNTPTSARVTLRWVYFRVVLSQMGIETHDPALMKQLDRVRNILKVKPNDFTHQRELALLPTIEAEIATLSKDHATAKNLYHEVVNQYRQTRDRWGLGWALIALASQYRYLKGFQEARTYLQESLDIFRAIGDQRGTATALFWMGGIERELGNYTEAKALRLESIRQIGQLYSPARLALFYEGVGNVAANVGDYPEATTYYQKCLQLQRDIGQRIAVTVTLNRITHIHLLRGELSEAERLIEESLALARQLNNPPRISAALANKAYLLWKKGRPAEALPLLDEALPLSQQGDASPNRLLNVLIRLGYVKAALDKVASAKVHLLEALQLAHTHEEIRSCLETLVALLKIDPALSPIERVTQLIFVTHHRNSTAEVRRLAQSELEHLRDQLTLGEYDTAQEQSRALTLETVVAEWLI